jgi:type IV pilus assembly protein PilE
MKKSFGFTLIELMIVVAVVAILAGLAFGAYSKQVRKSRRAEAKQVMSDYALREEKLRSNSAEYTNSVTVLLGVGTAPTLSYYSIAIATPTGNCDTGVAAAIGNSFQITATATGDQTKDTSCTPLVLANKCGLISKTPANCW